ncbi:MAG: TIGR00267 family protein [Candidatus Diapherotrites archaeon]|nr:TIGR00267 family protein [Candidatus Diapherotrites archaeon]
MIDNFVRGLVDGSLSTLGVVIGASTGSVQIILAAGLGGTVANGISNILGAFSAEKAVAYEELNGIEKAMVKKNLKGSILQRTVEGEVVKAGFVDGGATIVGGLIPVMPFILLPSQVALPVSIALVLVLLFFLGVYLGKVSKENLIFSGTKMVIYSIVIAVLAYAIQAVIIPTT